MKGTVLAINSGSSSVKFASFDIAPGVPPQRVVHGEVEGIGSAPRLRAWAHEGGALEERALELSSAGSGAHEETPGRPQVSSSPSGGLARSDRSGGSHDESEGRDQASSPSTAAADDHEAALAAILAWLAQHPSQSEPLAAVHRVVHGGEAFTAPIWVTPEVLAQLETLEPLAPLHQKHNLAAIRALSALQPALPQLACFDTAFHAGQPWVMRAYALPQRLSRAGVKGYGFHGLSYESIAGELPAHLGPAAEGKVVVAHLGNGASLCALQARQSVATSMGMTPLDGLMMGTRCGHLDPCVVLYLMAAHGLSAKQVETLLYKESGLLGVSGLSSDLRTLEASPLPEARAAIDLFVSRITRELGSMAAALGGLDALVFTGGIGEHSEAVRRRVCREVGWLGIELDETANLQHGPRISTSASRTSAWVIPTQEERMLVMHAQAMLREREPR